MLKSISVVSALLVMGLNTDSFSAQPQDQGAMVPFQGFVKKERKPMFTSQNLRLRSEMEVSAKRIEGACKAQGDFYKQTNKEVVGLLEKAASNYDKTMGVAEDMVHKTLTQLHQATANFRGEVTRITDTKEGVDQYLENVAAMLLFAKESSDADFLAAVGEINDATAEIVAQLPVHQCRTAMAIKAMIDKINER